MRRAARRDRNRLRFNAGLAETGAGTQWSRLGFGGAGRGARHPPPAAESGGEGGEGRCTKGTRGRHDPLRDPRTYSREAGPPGGSMARSIAGDQRLPGPARRVRGSGCRAGLAGVGRSPPTGRGRAPRVCSHQGAGWEGARTLFPDCARAGRSAAEGASTGSGEEAKTQPQPRSPPATRAPASARPDLEDFTQRPGPLLWNVGAEVSTAAREGGRRPRATLVHRPGREPKPVARVLPVLRVSTLTQRLRTEARASERAEAAGSPCGTHAPWHPHGWVRRRRRRRRLWAPPGLPDAGPTTHGLVPARARAPKLPPGWRKEPRLAGGAVSHTGLGRPRRAVILVPRPSPPAPAAPTFQAQAHECQSPRGARKVRSQAKGNSARRWDGKGGRRRRRGREHGWARAKSVPLLLSRGLDLPQTWGVGAHAGQSRHGRRASLQTRIRFWPI